MTTIPIPAAVPDLPPLPIGALAACALDLLQETGDLPQPRHISIFGSAQALGLQFDPETGSLNAVARWAARFGAILVSSPLTDEHGPGTWCRTDFDYYGVGVHVYTVIHKTETGNEGRAARARGLPARARPPVRLPGLRSPLPLHPR